MPRTPITSSKHIDYVYNGQPIQIYTESLLTVEHANGALEYIERALQIYREALWETLWKALDGKIEQELEFTDDSEPDFSYTLTIRAESEDLDRLTGFIIQAISRHVEYVNSTNKGGLAGGLDMEGGLTQGMNNIPSDKSSDKFGSFDPSYFPFLDPSPSDESFDYRPSDELPTYRGLLESIQVLTRTVGEMAKELNTLKSKDEPYFVPQVQVGPFDASSDEVEVRCDHEGYEDARSCGLCGQLLGSTPETLTDDDIAFFASLIETKERNDWQRMKSTTLDPKAKTIGDFTGEIDVIDALTHVFGSENVFVDPAFDLDPGRHMTADENEQAEQRFNVEPKPQLVQCVFCSELKPVGEVCPNCGFDAITGAFRPTKG